MTTTTREGQIDFITTGEKEKEVVMTVVELKRKQLYTPSPAVVFARQYAQSRRLERVTFRKYLAHRTLQKYGYESFLDYLLHSMAMQQKERETAHTISFGEEVPQPKSGEEEWSSGGESSSEPELSDDMQEEEAEEAEEEDVYGISGGGLYFKGSTYLERQRFLRELEKELKSAGVPR